MELSIFWELVLILLLLLLNGFFASAEIAIVAASKAELRQLASTGDKGAQLALQLAEQPNQFLATVQVGITLVGAFAAALGGVTIVQELADQIALVPIPYLAGRHQELALGIFVLGLTTASVILGELVPKQFALQNPTRLARLVSVPLHQLSQIARPVVWAIGKTTDGLLAIVGVKVTHQPGVSLMEIRHLLELGIEEGVLEPVEHKLAVEALRLSDRTVRQVMRSRVEIDAADIETPQDEVLGVLVMAGFSRLPVYEGDLDHILGFVHLKDVLRQHYLGWPLNLRRLIRPALFVPDTMHLDQLLVLFQDRRSPLAIVVDEFGATRGMVTLQDVLRGLVGDVGGEHHKPTLARITPLNDTTWDVQGTTPLAELLTVLERPDWEELVPRNITTVAGLVIAEMGHLPRVGESCLWQSLRFEVTEADSLRVERIVVRLVPPPAAEPPPAPTRSL